MGKYVDVEELVFQSVAGKYVDVEKLVFQSVALVHNFERRENKKKLIFQLLKYYNSNT